MAITKNQIIACTGKNPVAITPAKQKVSFVRPIDHVRSVLAGHPVASLFTGSRFGFNIITCMRAIEKVQTSPAVYDIRAAIALNHVIVRLPRPRA
ncbi:hypothetical protein CAY53_00910 [Desulfobulbus oralis]|uniref:Uncharacterized protein n=1 Tax=Desulfobulbus oralis TaxID=1986146 RepID=A0A2L1GKP9_9BACT|nr:hypothetical protein CAY53_00910 [Desulfobulbus oralis]